MYIKPEKCECGSKMYRVRAQTGKKDISLGYYCPVCQATLDINKEYLVPIDLIIRLDPSLASVPRRDAYLAILKTGDRAVWPVITKEMIGCARTTIGSALISSCRAPGTHKTTETDRNQLKKELQKESEDVMINPKKS